MHRKSVHDDALNRVIALMTVSQPMRMVTLAQHLGFEGNKMSNLLALCRTRKVPGFIKIHQAKGAYFYTIGEGKSLAPIVKPKIVHMPADLYRGWRNPATGVTGARLGV